MIYTYPNSNIGDRAFVRMLVQYTRVKFHEDPFRIDGALGFFQACPKNNKNKNNKNKNKIREQQRSLSGPKNRMRDRSNSVARTHGINQINKFKMLYLLIFSKNIFETISVKTLFQFYHNFLIVDETKIIDQIFFRYNQ